MEEPDDMKRLELGAEPFWMQDIRLAQRSIEAERARLRAAREASRSDELGNTGKDGGSK